MSKLLRDPIFSTGFAEETEGVAEATMDDPGVTGVVGREYVLNTTADGCNDGDKKDADQKVFENMYLARMRSSFSGSTLLREMREPVRKENDRCLHLHRQRCRLVLVVGKLTSTILRIYWNRRRKGADVDAN